MKLKFFFISCFFAMLLLHNTICRAQVRLACGTKKADTSFLLSMAMLERSATTRITSTTRMIKVFIHVLHNNDGTNEAISSAEVRNEFQDLLDDFSSNNLCFFLAGVDTIRSTALNVNFNADEDPDSEFSVYNVPGCLNIYYVNAILGSNNSCNPPCGIGGIALGGIPGTFCLIDDGNIGDHSISHEVGHCLGLSHTFATINGRECINGSNSWNAGDLVVDTNADPYSFNGSSCYSANGCSYFGTCNDPCGDDNYNPPSLNLMSYWNCSGTQVLTAGQFIRLNSVIDNNSSINALSSPTSYTLNATSVSSGYLIRSAINNFSTNGTINITSSAVASLGGNAVLVSPGFTARPTGEGSTTIKAHSCE